MIQDAMASRGPVSARSHVRRQHVPVAMPYVTEYAHPCRQL